MAELVKRDAPRAPSAPDPLRATDTAIAKLTRVVEDLVARPATAPAPAVSFPDPEPRPIRLEGDVERDAKGKMTRIIITPIY